MIQAADFYNINLLGEQEQALRLKALRKLMELNNCSHALVSSNSNIYYLTGRVFRGYIYIGPDTVAYFVRRPSVLKGADVHRIARPADIPAILAGYPGGMPDDIALELDTLPYSQTVRLCKALGIAIPQTDLSAILRRARAVKTECEIKLLRQSGRMQTMVYQQIPHVFREGMSDVEFQIEIERLSRLHGCLGQFRVAGAEMEIFMGNVLTGDNADTPSPYDFAMGGAGTSPSLPVGADGTIIHPSQVVMVDVNGNYTGYMTDMTRCFVQGEPEPEAIKANRLSADICLRLAGMMSPGTPAAQLYETAARMAAEAGMEQYFMGHRSHAPFVGHGVGIEINELPVIATKSRDILQQGNVIALEPKFVIPGIGAVGVENTYVVGNEAPGELITTCSEDIITMS